jgi:hypothetical protein|tara:strand:+ start:776 stop:1408 length:633 start_codon:yes stop_codon:yes gene_type:complete
MIAVQPKGDNMIADDRDWRITDGSVFAILDSMNVNEYTEEKGQFTYLSWTFAVRELLKVDPQATWEICEYQQADGETAPYMMTAAGAFVKVKVWVGGICREQVHPVLNNYNKTAEEPNAFDVNKSIMRCLTKAIALHGLGLYIYAGEDLPEDREPVSEEENTRLLEIAASISKEEEEKVSEAVIAGKITRDNYSASLAKLQRLAEESTDE